MIFDKIENINRYQLPQEGFEELKIFLASFDLNAFKKGKFDINGEQLFGIGLEYNTKLAEECLWEAHQKYIDIHMILEGEEKIYINDISNTKLTKTYDKKDDYALFEGEKKDSILLKSGEFLILYPNEVHKTSIISKHHPEKVNKIVFKLR